MRVVALVHFYVPHHMAGSETMLHAMLCALVDAGHEVHVVTTSEPLVDRYEIDDVVVHPVVNRMAARSMLADLSPDVVVAHHFETRTASRWARFAKLPVVQIVHNTFPEHVSNAREGNPALVVFNSHWVQRHFLEQGARPRRSLVLYPPIEAERHRTTPGAKVTLVNLNANKGAEVFYRLAEHMPDVEFLGVVGGYGEQIIRSLPNVQIHPHVTDPRIIWAQTRILLVPSAYESFGMVGIEAAHSGIPTVASPTAGLIESLGAAGRFADPRYLGEWVDQVRVLLKPRVWAKASAAAKKRAHELDPTASLREWTTAVEGLCSTSMWSHTTPERHKRLRSLPR